MDFHVRLVASINSCFVSLPLSLIQTLQSTSSSLPHLLTLELRPSLSTVTNHHSPWLVAWSGATSSSHSIEVDQQFAECLGLLDDTSVRVRVVSNVPKASLVTIEPLTEDDWEVLELNSELAEAAILNQVRVVHEAMKFPLWLHGSSVIMFQVISTVPKNAAVQLMPGTEVAVAPKSRKKNMNKHRESCTQSFNTAKALLRVQDADRRLIHKTDVKGVELGVVLTSVGFIHPETAKNFSLDALQLVAIAPRVSSNESMKGPETGDSRISNSSSRKEVNGTALTDKKESRQALIRLLISDSVVNGHIMIAQSLRLYLKAGLHSWVHLKGHNGYLKKEIPGVSLCPCHFKTFGKDKPVENGLAGLNSHKNHRKTNAFPKNSSVTQFEVFDWAAHNEVVATFSRESPCTEDEDIVYQANERKGLECLLHSWFLVQLAAITANSGVGINTVVLGTETLLCFEVKGHKVGTSINVPALSTVFQENRNKTREMPAEILYVLKISEESLHSGRVYAYELSFKNETNGRNSNLSDFEMFFGNLNLGEPVSFYSIQERTSSKGFRSNVSSFSWMESAASDVINRVMVLLSPASGMWFSTNNLPLPGHVLIHGPPGSGKTSLAKAVAKSLEESEDLLAHIVFVGCSRLAVEKGPTIRQALSNSLSEALDHAPSLVIFDDLDSIISSSSDSEGSQLSSSVVALTKFLTDIMDEYGDKWQSSCGIGPLAFIASAQSLDSLPPSLCSSGRFDFHVQLAAPDVSGREAMLKYEIERRSLECADNVLLDVASKCDGYDAYDLEILVDRAVHAATGRFLPSQSGIQKPVKPSLVRDDFTQAMHDFTPVAMRDITKSAPEGGLSGWGDVGGLADICNTIKEMIELPSKFPSIFSKAPLRLRSSVLLYGPPGCGKTLIVGAAAAACSLRFISVKGPELLNKYIGASEQAVREMFSKAAAAAPCLLFFDEFDSIAPKRGHDNTGVTDRVVNQFLTELDGVEVLTGVFVFAATSRPDLLDAALLRPGRLDRLLFCDFPSPRERLDILTVLSRKLPLAGDVDLDAIADMTEGFSGADLQALLADAQLAAVHELLNDADKDALQNKPVITDSLLKSIASKARPSVSEAEKQRLYHIYGQFLDSKKSVAAKSRDAKGKRATLA